MNEHSDEASGLLSLEGDLARYLIHKQVSALLQPTGPACSAPLTAATGNWHDYEGARPCEIALDRKHGVTLDMMRSARRELMVKTLRSRREVHNTGQDKGQLRARKNHPSATPE
jgi:hypothetical protein